MGPRGPPGPTGSPVSTHSLSGWSLMFEKNRKDDPLLIWCWGFLLWSPFRALKDFKAALVNRESLALVWVCGKGGCLFERPGVYGVTQLTHSCTSFLLPNMSVNLSQDCKCQTQWITDKREATGYLPVVWLIESYPVWGLILPEVNFSGWLHENFAWSLGLLAGQLLACSFTYIPVDPSFMT